MPLNQRGQPQTSFSPALITSTYSDTPSCPSYGTCHTQSMHATLLSKAVQLFIIHGQQLCHLLRLEGSNLSDTDLHMLKAQLHRVELEATHCQIPKRVPSDHVS